MAARVHDKKMRAERSCSLFLMRSTFPEILEASAESGAAKGNDGVGSREGPMHARALASSADGYFAAGFEDAGRGTEALGLKLKVLHAMAVAAKEVDSLLCFWAGNTVFFQSENDGVDVFGIELVMPESGPGFGLRMVAAKDGLGHHANPFFDVVAIRDLHRIRK